MIGTLAKVFIGGFPPDMLEIQLAELIAPYGAMSLMKIIRERATGKCKGYAFVEMARPEAAYKLIHALHRTEYRGWVLKASICGTAAQQPAYKSSVKITRSGPEGRPRRPRIQRP